MANKRKISLSLAFIALIVILLTSQAKAASESEDDGFKKNPDGVISDPRLENLLQDMIETTRKILHKSSTVGNSEMVRQCAIEFSDCLVKLNKAMDLYRRGVKEEKGFKELATLVEEASKSYKKCDKGFADEYKPSPFSAYDAWLYKLAQKTEKQIESDAEKA